MIFGEEKISGKNKQAVRNLLRSDHQTTLYILGKSSRESVDRDFKWRSGSKASIASHAFIPTQTPMRSLCSGLHVLTADRLVSF